MPPITQDDNPLRREHWFGWVDARPIALMRIVLGATLLFDLAARAPDVPDWFSERGVLPLASMRRLPISIFALSDRPPFVMALFAAGAVVTTAFLLGYRTRIATALTWLFFFSLYQRDSLCDDGADTIARTLLFFAMFSDLGAEWSLDRWLSDRAGRIEGDFVRAWPVRCLQLVLAAFYLAVARNKIQSGWLGGGVLYQLLEVDGFTRPPAALLLAYPSLCTVLNHATWMLELAIPLLAYFPWQVKRMRLGCFVASLGLQLGIAGFVKPGIHQPVMIACALLWIPPYLLGKEVLRKRELRSLERTRSDPPEGEPRTVSRPRFAAFALASAQAAIAIAIALAARRMPAWTARELSTVGLTLPTDLFSRPVPVVRWSAPGTLADGTTLDILPITRPELACTSRWFSTRWFKFMYRDDAIQWPDLGRYLCGRWASQATGRPALRRFSLVRETHVPAAPRHPPMPPSIDEPLTQTCADSRPADGARP